MSTSSGKRGRLSRIVHPASKRATILALDHGFTMGPVSGLERIGQRLQGIERDAIDAVVVHQGMVSRLLPLFESAQRPGLIVHLSGATQLSPDASEKRLVCTVEHALRLGADGVSVHANLGARTENQMLSDLAKVSEACQHWGVPLLAMMYPPREDQAAAIEPEHAAHAIRVAMELGADLIKIPYTGDKETFARVLENVDVPVFVAGGTRLESEEAILHFVHDALQAGASGVTFGRNIFQSPHPRRIARAVAAIVHQGIDVRESMAFLNEDPPAGARTAAPRKETLPDAFPAAFAVPEDPIPAAR